MATTTNEYLVLSVRALAYEIISAIRDKLNSVPEEDIVVGLEIEIANLAASIRLAGPDAPD